MEASSIKLTNTSKMFEYEKISREIESCDNLDVLKNMLRCYIKLYMKQQEAIIELFPHYNGQNNDQISDTTEYPDWT